MKRIALAAMVFLVVAMAAPLNAEEDKGVEMIVDAFLLRPMGAVATAIGFGAFVISSPFTAIDNRTEEAFYWMVERPADYTFSRPLGEFEEGY